MIPLGARLVAFWALLTVTTDDQAASPEAGDDEPNSEALQNMLKAIRAARKLPRECRDRLHAISVPLSRPYKTASAANIRLRPAV